MQYACVRREATNFFFYILEITTWQGTTAVDRRSDKWATSTSADVSVPRLYHYHYLPGSP